MAGDDAASDAVLIRRAREGDERSFGLLCERYAGSLRAQVRRSLPASLRRKLSASDILQEAYLTSFQRLAGFEDRGDGSFGAWISRIAAYKVREAVRAYGGTAKRAVDHEVSRTRRGDTANFAARGPTPSEEAVAGELREAASEALVTLPADYREVLRLLQERHLTVEEAAARMGRSREAVKKLYGRALSRFAELLAVDRGAGRARG